MVVPEDFKGAKEAVLEYEQLSTLAVFGDGRESVKKLPEVSLVRIRLLTGRHHQIRVQFANAGYPLLGDNKYGNDASRDLSAKAAGQLSSHRVASALRRCALCDSAPR